MIEKVRTSDKAVVFVIDNDPEIHGLISNVARQMGLRCMSYSNGLSFLDSVDEQAMWERSSGQSSWIVDADV